MRGRLQVRGSPLQSPEEFLREEALREDRSPENDPLLQGCLQRLPAAAPGALSRAAFPERDGHLQARKRKRVLLLREGGRGGGIYYISIIILRILLFSLEKISRRIENCSLPPEQACQNLDSIPEILNFLAQNDIMECGSISLRSSERLRECPVIPTLFLSQAAF